MCGIVGIFNPSREGNFSREAREMNATLVHRGPDDSGEFSAPGVSLAMRRLSIIDLATGKQPISNEDETVVVIFNGEIYNHREIRAGLKARGHRFKTQADTEVLVHLYEEKKEGLLDDLNGMFAIALYDAKAHRLLLARDPFGQKPLYYEIRPDGTLAFASELKALLAHDTRGADLTRTIDPEAVSLYLSHLAIPSPYTIYKEIRRIAPGEALLADSSGFHRKRYWHPDFALAAAPPKEKDLEAELTDRLTAAIRRHLIADVERGAFLSGGLDSTIVVTLMREVMGEGVKTFSVGFEDPSFDETPEIETTVRELGLDHRHIVCAPPPRGFADVLLDSFDEPFADYSAIPTHLVAREAAREVKVALTGDGGDEVFGGYPTYQAPYWADAFARLPRFVRRAVAAGAARLPASFERIPVEYRLKRLATSGEIPNPARHLHWMDPFPGEAKRNLILGAPELLPGHAVYLRPWREAENADPVRRLAYLDLCIYLPDRTLVKADRMSMAHSLELRAPLLDRELVEWALHLPGKFLVSPFETKRLFRRALARRFPRLARVPKKGFAPPLSKWLRGQMRAEVEETLHDTAARRWGFRREAITRIWADHLAGRSDEFRGIWALHVLMRFLAREEAAGRRHSLIPPAGPA